MEDRKLLRAVRRHGLLSESAHGVPTAMRDEHERGVSWGFFLVVVPVVLCIGVALSVSV